MSQTHFSANLDLTNLNYELIVYASSMGVIFNNLQVSPCNGHINVDVDCNSRQNLITFLSSDFILLTLDECEEFISEFPGGVNTISDYK